jgi:peptide/nickel transport system ATP-binding protein
LLSDGGAICEKEVPPWREVGQEHRIHCHIPLEQLRELAPAVKMRNV